MPRREVSISRAAWRACTAGASPSASSSRPSCSSSTSSIRCRGSTTPAAGRQPPRAAACSCDGQRSRAWAGSVRSGRRSSTTSTWPGSSRAPGDGSGSRSAAATSGASARTPSARGGAWCGEPPSTSSATPTLRLAATLAGLLLLFALPPGLVTLALGGFGLSSGWRVALGLLGASAWAVSAIAYLPAIRRYGLARLWALTLPVSGLLYGGMTLDSAARHVRSRAPAEW